MLVILVNLLVDIAYALLDPRVGASEAAGMNVLGRLLRSPEGVAGLVLLSPAGARGAACAGRCFRAIRCRSSDRRWCRPFPTPPSRSAPTGSDAMCWPA